MRNHRAWGPGAAARLRDFFEKEAYPNANDKRMLCELTGLTTKQLTDWFTNKRRRSTDWTTANPRVLKSQFAEERAAVGVHHCGPALECCYVESADGMFDPQEQGSQEPLWHPSDAAHPLPCEICNCHDVGADQGPYVQLMQDARHFGHAAAAPYVHPQPMQPPSAAPSIHIGPDAGADAAAPGQTHASHAGDVSGSCTPGAADGDVVVRVLEQPVRPMPDGWALPEGTGVAAGQGVVPSAWALPEGASVAGGQEVVPEICWPMSVYLQDEGGVYSQDEGGHLPQHDAHYDQHFDANSQVLFFAGGENTCMLDMIWTRLEGHQDAGALGGPTTTVASSSATTASESWSVASKPAPERASSTSSSARRSTCVTPPINLGFETEAEGPERVPNPAGDPPKCKKPATVITAEEAHLI